MSEEEVDEESVDSASTPGDQDDEPTSQGHEGMMDEDDDENEGEEVENGEEGDGIDI